MRDYSRIDFVKCSICDRVICYANFPIDAGDDVEYYCKTCVNKGLHKRFKK